MTNTRLSALVIAACCASIFGLVAWRHSANQNLMSAVAPRSGVMATTSFVPASMRAPCRQTRMFAEDEDKPAEKKAPVFINKFRKPNSPVRIRLARKGKHKAPFYRIVVQDSRRIPNGRFLEHVGFYDPLKTTGKVSLNLERIKYWLGVGAKPSQTVARFLELLEHVGFYD